MEAMIILVIFVVVVAMMMKSSSAQNQNAGQENQYTAEQLRDRYYKISKQLAKMSTESANIICNLQATDADMRHHERLSVKMAALEKESELIKVELSRVRDKKERAIQELNGSMQRHVELVMILMNEKGFTEEQANTAILKEIEARQRQYQLEGLSEEQALEKAGHETYRLAE